MASLTLITITLVVNVLAILIQTCTCGLSLNPAHLYTEASFPSSKKTEHGSVIYVPVCTSDCHKPSHLHQYHISPTCLQKPSVGNLPLEDHGHNYHLQLGLGKSSYLHSLPVVGKDFHSAISTGHYQQASLSGIKQSSDYHSGYQHLDSISHKNHHSGGSATVYQKNDHHSSEQKQQIHHGHGVSHQVIKQEHQQGYHDLSSQVHDHGYGHGQEYDESHHKKDHNAHYQFEYSVNDHKTGDVKRHKEERKGDVVNGEYSLLEEDGNVRTVKYYADWKSGFHAQVHNTKPRIK